MDSTVDDANEGNAQPRSALWLALQKLTEGQGVQRDNLVAALAGELAELQKWWGVNVSHSDDITSENRMKLARRALVLNIDTHVRRLQPPQGVARPLYEKVVYVSFNTLTEKSHSELIEKDLPGRRKWLLEHLHEGQQVSIRTMRRYLIHAITQIEQQILAAGYKPVEVNSEDSTAPDDHPNDTKSVADNSISALTQNISVVIRPDTQPTPATVPFEPSERTAFTGTLPNPLTYTNSPGIPSGPPKPEIIQLTMDLKDGSHFEIDYPLPPGVVRKETYTEAELDPFTPDPEPSVGKLPSSFRHTRFGYHLFGWLVKWAEDRARNRRIIRVHRFAASVDQTLRNNPGLVELARNDDANAILAFSGGTRKGAEEVAVEMFGTSDSYDSMLAIRTATPYLGRQGCKNAAAALKTLAQNQSHAVPPGRFATVYRGIWRLASNPRYKGSSVELHRLLAHSYQELSRENGRVDLGGPWDDDEIRAIAREDAKVGARWMAEAGGSREEQVLKWHRDYHITIADLSMMEAIHELPVMKLVQGDVYQMMQLLGSKEEQGTLERMLESDYRRHRFEAAILVLEIYGARSQANAYTQGLVSQFLHRAGMEQADPDLADWLVIRARLGGVSGAQLSARARIDRRP